MNWTGILIFAGVIAVFIFLKRAGQISAKSAREHLKNGALVIDVRSRGEFNSGHLSQAVNIPLDEIETDIARRVPDKNRVLLLHCLSGTRSAFAKNKLKKLGYTSVFNLGSVARMRKICDNAAVYK